MTLVGECRFDGAFTFVYSARAGTEAALFPGRIPEVTVKRRMHELVSLTQQIALAKNQALAGSEVVVLIEGPSRQGGSQRRGRTRRNKIVNFTAAGSSSAPATGSFTLVTIDSATSTTLKGHQSA